MRDHLKAANKNFDKIKDRDYIINPISSVDAEIITELVEIMKKSGDNEVANILKEWKYLKDDEVRDQLLDVNMNRSKIKYDEGISPLDELLNEGVEKVKEKFDRRTEFVDLNDDSIAAYLIFGYHVSETYDDDDRYEGKLIINPTDISATKQPLYANYTITYYDEENLERAEQMLRDQLRKANIKFVTDDIAEEDKEEGEDDSRISGREPDAD